MFCAPDRAAASKDGSCLSLAEMQVIAQDFNQTVSNAALRIPLHADKNALHDAIQKALTHSSCRGEYCWIDQPFLRSDHKASLERAFRPKVPSAWLSNPRTWLNTDNIVQVLQQYEKLYTDFAFLGVHPIDFQARYSSGQCIGGEGLCNFKVADLIAKGKTQFGMVLNLDKHNQSGSHWVAVYGQLDAEKANANYGVYYYDSVGMAPPPEARAFMKQVAGQMAKPSPARKFAVKHNKVQRQFKNTECGMFSIVFLTQCMKKNISFDYICKHMRKDDGIQEIRQVIYRPHQGGNKILKAKSHPKTKKA